jgi:C4-dicarboxylate-binding protein DctP
MQTTVRKLAAPALALALACAPLHAVLAQSQVLIVQDASVNSVKDNSFKLFKKLVEEKLGNKVAIIISENDALYNQESEIPAEQLGAIQLCAPGTGLFTNAFPKVTVLTLPYLLPTPQAFQAAVDDPKIGGVIFAELRKKNLEPLAIWLNGPRDVGRTGDKPILWPQDMKGVKIRVAPGDSYVDAFKILGANVTTMSFAQVPTALRQGVLDAVEPTPNAWVSSHLYEIAKQITKTGYIWDTYIVIANKLWWDGLSPDTRQVMKNAMTQATKWNWDNVDADNERAIKVMRKAGDHIYDLTPAQLAAWKAAERPLWASIGNKLVGADVMKQLIAIGEKYH